MCRYDVRTVYQAVLLTLEKLVEDEAVQAAGVVAILDWSNFPARLTTSLSPKLLRLMLDGLQVAYRHGTIKIKSLSKLSCHHCNKLAYHMCTSTVYS